MIENFREIPLGKSILSKQLFSSEDDLIKHLESYLTEQYDAIVVLKFREHLPELSTIWMNIYVLELLQEESAKFEDPDNKVEIPFRLVDFRNNDWFIEVLAVLGGLGGLAGVIQLIYTIIHDKKIETKQKVSETRQIPVTVQGQIIYQRQTFHKIQTIELTTIGELEFSVEKIAQYYEEELELIEIYSKDGLVKQVTIEELLKGESNEGDDVSSEKESQ